jgi:hypothetical protein
MQMTSSVRPVQVFLATTGQDVERFGVYVRTEGHRETFVGTFDTERDARTVARHFGPIDDEPVKVWTPTIGQRVRVHASAECPNYRYGGLIDGAVGVITDTISYERLARAGIEHPDHRFEVTFDDGHRDKCCAAELEPLDDLEA